MVTIATRAAVVLARLVANHMPMPAPNNSAPATRKSAGPQATSSVKRMAISGTSKSAPVMTPVTIIDLRIGRLFYSLRGSAPSLGRERNPTTLAFHCLQRHHLDCCLRNAEVRMAYEQLRRLIRRVRLDDLIQHDVVACIFHAC